LGKQQYPLISLCMIVKNEEKNIVRCLNSVKDYVDEILILDTGSSDQTPLLAEQMGAIVHYGSWENDFSKARNLSKQHARGKWILFLDADEEISQETGQRLRQLAQRSEVAAYTFSIINYTTNDKNSQKQIGINLRMFKNNPSYTFEGAIHEQVKPSIVRNNPSAVILHSNLSITHYGYCADNPHRKQKNLRNIEILEKVLKEKPTNDYNHYNLGVSYYVNGQLEKAKKHFQLAINYASRKASYLPALYRNFAVCLNDLGEYEGALSLIAEGLTHYPDYPDLYYLQGQIYVSLKLFKLAENCFGKCLKFTRINPEYVSTQGVNSFLAHEYLADIYFHQQDWERALEQQVQAIRVGAKSFKSVMRLALFAHHKFNNNDEFDKILKKELEYLSLQDRIKVLFHGCCYELVLKNIKLLPQPEPEILLLAAKSCMKLKDWQNAQKYIIQIPDTSPDYLKAQILGCICCCFEAKKASIYLNKLAINNPAYAQVCEVINDIFLGKHVEQSTLEEQLITSQQPLTTDSSHQSPVTSHFFLDLAFQLIDYDLETTLDVLKNKIEPVTFGHLCYELGKLANKSNNLPLTKTLFRLTLSYGYRSFDIYRLLGEILILSGEELEGIYFVRQATLEQPNKSANYCSLLNNLVSYFEEQLREIINLYPHLDLAKHHLFALATFKAKLTRKEELK